MSRYDGLIIPRSYNEYINKTDPVAMSQALQLSGVLSAIVAAGDNKAVKSSAVYEALTNYINKTDADTLQQALQLPGVLSEAVASGDNKAVKSSAVNNTLASYAQGKLILLPNGADLNNYKDRGEYLANTDAIGNSITNRPNQEGNIFGFSMSVHNSGNGIVTQIVFCLIGIYVRKANDTEWSNWKTVINY